MNDADHIASVAIGGAINFGDDRLPARFWIKCQPHPVTGCWIWEASLDRDGYGWFYVRGKGKVRAHSVAYVALVGQVPAGLELDHRCETRSCVNPRCLDVVTHAENIRRQADPTRRAHHVPLLVDDDQLGWAL